MTSFMLVGAIIIIIASATFVEKWHGAELARDVIYHSPITITLWVLLVVNTVLVAIKRRWFYRKAWGTITLHLSFIVTLLGALITHCFSYEGLLHLREGESTNIITTNEGSRELPFVVRLVDFTLERYAGTQMPSAYKSEVEIIVDGEVVDIAMIAVNRVYDRDGFRLFQSSYDGDELGSVMSVNCDYAGMMISYTGYLLMLIGILLIITRGNSHFRALVRELSALRIVVLLLVVSTTVTPLMAQGTIPKEHSKSVEHLLIQNASGRIEPMDSFSAKLLRKISKRSSFDGYSAVEVVWGFIFNPSYWCSVDIISQNSEHIAIEFDLKKGRIAFDDLFDSEGCYILSEAVVAASAMENGVRREREKELLKLNERVNVIYSLIDGSMLKWLPLPGDSDGRWFSIDDDMSEFRGDDSMFVTKIIPWYTQSLFEASSSGDWSEPNEIVEMVEIYQRKRSSVIVPSQRQVCIEILYNKVEPFFWAMIGYLLSGVALFFAALRCSRGRVAITLLSLCFTLQTIAIAARWYISEQMPWASAYESLIHVGWAAALAAIIFSLRSLLASSLASFFSGVVLFVAALNWLDPEITPLVPVLKSSWLMIHVATITSAYGLMGISAMIGIVGVVMTLLGRSRVLHELRLVSEITLHVALYFMIVGIFVGAIWANESWGRYWGWDPKETWALITMLLYALALHLRFSRYLRSDHAHFTLSVLCFASVLMTYFGVNYYLTGLHAYASGYMPNSIYIIHIFYILFIALAIVAHLKKREQ